MNIFKKENSAMGFRRISFLLTSFLVLASTIVEAQQPRIDSLSAQTLTRSGRLRIFGANFGSSNTGSQVLVGGYSAIISRWSASQITAYVPEEAGPGSVSVQVVTSGGSSNTVPLNVTLRQRQGRVKWAFEADVENLWFRPALAPDGTVYVHGSEGYVYALTPDGGLKWIHKANWYAYVPPAAGPEGEVYVGSIQRVTAINPDGTERWRFTDTTAQGLKCGGAIGPDGNIYFANDWGLGAYSLSRAGQMRWNNPGNPRIIWYGTTGAETVLGPRTNGGPVEQMYVYSSWMLHAFSLTDGSQRFAISLGQQQQTQPAVGPDGVIYITHLRSQGWALEAFSPTNGQSLWYYHGNAVSGMSPPDVGPDGIVYYAQDDSRIIAFNPNTQTPNWTYQDGTVLYYPTVSPRNDLVVAGGVLTFGDVGFVKGISRSSGQLLWTVPLPGAFYPSPRVVPVHHPRFTPDGSTVYVSTTILSGSSANPHSYLYAIVAGDTTTDVAASSEVPQEFRLFQNYPNPFNPSTRIPFAVRGSGFVALKVYDILGREVRTLVNDNLQPGRYEVTFNAAHLASGVYYYRLTAGTSSDTKKLILLK
ncbi:MAG: PQQ-binding-like beta-propeller repeat protein [Ignavibacterium sp.]|nr:PQQ-binding-like beta-propeller repeat protein [Ignavibacterium sp.]